MVTCHGRDGSGRVKVEQISITNGGGEEKDQHQGATMEMQSIRLTGSALSHTITLLRTSTHIVRRQLLVRNICIVVMNRSMASNHNFLVVTRATGAVSHVVIVAERCESLRDIRGGDGCRAAAQGTAVAWSCGGRASKDSGDGDGGEQIHLGDWRGCEMKRIGEQGRGAADLYEGFAPRWVDASVCGFDSPLRISQRCLVPKSDRGICRCGRIARTRYLMSGYPEWA